MKIDIISRIVGCANIRLHHSKFLSEYKSVLTAVPMVADDLDHHESLHILQGLASMGFLWKDLDSTVRNALRKIIKNHLMAFNLEHTAILLAALTMLEVDTLINSFEFACFKKPDNRFDFLHDQTRYQFFIAYKLGGYKNFPSKLLAEFSAEPTDTQLRTFEKQIQLELKSQGFSMTGAYIADASQFLPFTFQSEGGKQYALFIKKDQDFYAAPHHQVLLKSTQIRMDLLIKAGVNLIEISEREWEAQKLTSVIKTLTESGDLPKPPSQSLTAPVAATMGPVRTPLTTRTEAPKSPDHLLRPEAVSKRRPGCFKPVEAKIASPQGDIVHTSSQRTWSSLFSQPRLARSNSFSNATDYKNHTPPDLKSTVDFPSLEAQKIPQVSGNRSSTSRGRSSSLNREYVSHNNPRRG